MYRRVLLIVLLLIVCCHVGSAQVIIKQDTVDCSIYFHQGKSYFDPVYKDNGKRLKAFVEDVYFRSNDPSMAIKKIVINSGASPEGPQKLNYSLSDRRAQAIINYLKQNTKLDESMIMVYSPGVDWEKLISLVEASDDVPDKEAVLQIMTSEEWGEDDVARRKCLEKYNGGISYRWMYRHLFPLVRHSRASIAYVSTFNKDPMLSEIPKITYSPKVSLPADTFKLIPPVPMLPQSDVCRFYMSVQTNLLYDVVAVPNIGVEFYLGKGFSIDANWMYAWWHSDPAHYYWRTYGGDLAARWWFGRSAKEKPLTGHHVGLYGQVLTYDFAFGGLGQIGGVPGGTLWDKANFTAGLEYGYSLPVATRLNLDFTIGFGYHWGEYSEYIPVDNCYVWQATKYRRWIGPTKAEISLVWLIGKGNYNRGKGGVR